MSALALLAKHKLQASPVPRTWRRGSRRGVRALARLRRARPCGWRLVASAAMQPRTALQQIACPSETLRLASGERRASKRVMSAWAVCKAGRDPPRILRTISANAQEPPWRRRPPSTRWGRAPVPRVRIPHWRACHKRTPALQRQRRSLPGRHDECFPRAVSLRRPPWIEGERKRDPATSFQNGSPLGRETKPPNAAMLLKWLKAMVVSPESPSTALNLAPLKQVIYHMLAKHVFPPEFLATGTRAT